MPTALNDDELDALIARFDTLVAKALRRAVKTGTSEALTAAAVQEPTEPGPPPAYEPPTPGLVPVLPAATVTLDDLILIERAWRREVQTVIIPELERTMRAAADKVLERIAGKAPVLWDASQPQAQVFLTQTENQLVGVGDDMWKRTRDQLIIGMQDGESIQQLSARVKEVLSTIDARARTIARTEVIGASNAGAYQQLQLLGNDAPARKTWLSTRDGRTRLTHRAANGQTVEFGAPFTVGGARFDYPGDPNAPADERINCRCTLVWHFDDMPLKSSGNPLEMFKAGDPYVRDNHGRFAPKGHGGAGGGATSGGGGGEAKKELKPSHIQGHHYNDAEKSELAQIEADHKAGKLNDKEYKYKTYYVKVKASKRINKSGGTGTEAKKVESKKVEHKKSGEFKTGDKVDTPMGEATVTSHISSKSVIVKTSDGKTHLISKDEIAHSSGTKKPPIEGKVVEKTPRHDIKPGDTVIVPSGKKGKVISEAGDHAAVQVSDGDQFIFHKSKLKKKSEGPTPTDHSPTPSAPTHHTPKQAIKPSQVMNHQLNGDEQKELADLDAKLKSGEITSAEYTKKAYYVKVKASKRINKSGGGATMPSGGVKTGGTGGISTHMPGVSTLPEGIRQEHSSTRSMAIKNGEILRKQARSKIDASHNTVGGWNDPGVKAHDTYTGSGYKPINHYARTGKPHPYYDMPTSESAKHIKNLDAMYATHGVTNGQPILVVRGVRGEYAQQLKQLKVGDVITERGFMSTSTKTDTPKGFKASNGVMMEIGVPSGKRFIAGTDYEHEILFPRNAQLRVVGKSANGAIQFDML